tara:strand:- start:386 stop:1018 length:633 start_codon:yes stop_codon:yes gene_type:complete
MCIPLLVGTALTTAGPGAIVTSPFTAGLFGAGGSFGAGGLLSGAFSSLSNMSSLLNLASFGTSSYGQYYSSAIAQQNMIRQAQIMDYNARIANNNALMAEYSAEVDAQNFDKRLRSIMGRQNVLAAASNVVINQDSPLNVAADTAREGMLERLQILNRGEIAASASRAKALGETSAAETARANAATIPTTTGVSLLADAFGTGKTLLENV